VKKSEENGHLCLLSDFRGNDFSFSPLSMILAIGLLCIAFIMLRYIPSIPSFLRAFIMKCCWTLSRLFLHLLRWSSVQTCFLFEKQCCFPQAKYCPRETVAAVNLLWVRLGSDNSLCLKNRDELQENTWKCQYFPRLWDFWKISYSCVLLLGPFPFQVILTVRATTEKGKLEWSINWTQKALLVIVHLYAINNLWKTHLSITQIWTSRDNLLYPSSEVWR
jgi:hypothetical protein